MMILLNYTTLRCLFKIDFNDIFMRLIATKKINLILFDNDL